MHPRLGSIAPVHLPLHVGGFHNEKDFDTRLLAWEQLLFAKHLRALKL